MLDERVIKDSSFVLDGVVVTAMLVVVLTTVCKVFAFFNLKL